MSTFRQKVQATTNWVQPDPDDAGEPRAKRFRRQPRKEPRSRVPSQTPVTAHRLFPVFAALWFAALFGLGSLAISGEVLGAIVSAIGLPALVPLTAPPLGFTAHLLVAFALTIAGAALGFFGALRLRARGQVQAVSPAEPAPRPAPAPETGDMPRVRARDAHPDAPPRRPLVLTEAFADEPAEAPEEPALPAAEAPLLRRKPGQSASAVLASEPEPWIPVFTPGGESVIEPLDLAALDLSELAQAAPVAAVEPEPASAAAAPFAPPPTSAPQPQPLPEPAPEPVPTLLAATPQLPRGFAAALPDLERLKAGETWSPVAGASLDALGLVQLIERLALAIAARKAASDAGPTPPTTGIGPDAETAVEPAPVAEAMPVPDSSTLPLQFETRPDAAPPANGEPVGSAREAILRRLGAIAAAPAPIAPVPAAPLETAHMPFSRPVRVEAAPAPVDPVVPLRPAEPSAGPGPFAAPAARAAASPAQPAPAASPAEVPVPFETDAALRSALATLQRMTARG
ncbi:MAG: hypothetical protein WCL10_03325 [Novosphingobium sp.]|uniref:hypothetical protein n=1 Tax=Novosphingobium sp. TaxID=1874826 RepID=UPI00301A456D